MLSQRFVFGYVFCSLVFATVASAQSLQSSKNSQPIATVNGQAIYADDLAPMVEGQLLPLRNQEYEIKRKALDSLIEQKLLEAAAKSKGVTTEQFLAQNADAKVPEPNDAEVEGYYMALRERITLTYDEVKPKLRESLKQAKIQQARQDYMKNLRAQSNVAVLMSVPRVNVGYDPARLKGDPKAPVMIVEFSDYQCPYCHQVEPTLQAIMHKYGDKVSLAYRDYPLRNIHDHAEIAAEASRCALDQGKFWDYHDQLFKATNLDKEALIGYAKDAKLDDKQFEACLTSEKYKAQIDKDLDEGRKAGVNGTPVFFINGIVLSGVQAQDSFTHAIDDELSKKPATATMQQSSDRSKSVAVSRASTN